MALPTGLRRFGFALSCLLLGGLLISTVSGESPAAQRPRVIAIRNVHVVPLSEVGVLRNQTVVVEDGRIAVVQPASEVRIPEGAKIVDGTDRYLCPGLTDGHVHLDTDEFSDAPLYIAHGITTVFNMRGKPKHIEWRERLKAGLFGPNIYTSGEFINEPAVNTPEEVEAEVEQQAKDGYDFLKYHPYIDEKLDRYVTTTGLTRASLRRLIEVSQKKNMPLIGHAPESLGVRVGVEEGLSLAHANMFELAMDWRDATHEDIEALVHLCKQNGIYVATTVVVQHCFDYADAPELKYVSPDSIADWQSHVRLPSAAKRKRLRGVQAFLRRVVGSLHRAGVPVFMGSDTGGCWYLIPGIASHAELQILVNSGLSPFEVIRSATVVPAAFLNEDKEFGTVEVGKRADLLMVSRNPLENIDCLKRPLGVMVRGEWFSKKQLDTMLEKIAQSHRAERKTDK